MKKYIIAALMAMVTGCLAGNMDTNRPNVINSSDSGSPGFNPAGTALTDQSSAAAAGDWFSFTIGTTETFVLRNYVMPESDASVVLKEVDFTSFSSNQEVVWTFYL